MRRAQNKSSGLQSGAQGTQRTTGNVSGTGTNVTGATSSSVSDQPTTTRTESTTTYARDPYAQGSRQSGRASSGKSGSMGIGHSGIGGILTMVAGLLTFFAGLAAVVRSTFFRAVPHYPYRLTSYSWGWILFALGVLLFFAGACHLLGLSFGRIAGIAFAVLGTIAGFMFLAYSPLWGFLIVALSVVAIWSLFHNREQDERTDEFEHLGEGSMGARSAGSVPMESTGTTTTTTSRQQSMRV
jgi:hypothetical protein